jgi:predicted transcriptional regulator
MSYMKGSEPLETRPTQVRLRPDQRPKLEAIIKKEDRDLSWIIRKALDEFIERYGKKKN